MDFEPGMLVRSKAGRDKGRVYVVVRAGADGIYLADGDKRPLSRMKKKNSRHLQPILKERLDDLSGDEPIREICRRVENYVKS